MAKTASTLDGVHLTNRYDLQFTFAATVPSLLCHERADSETGAYLMPTRHCLDLEDAVVRQIRLLTPKLHFSFFPTVCDQVPLSSKGMQVASLLV